jgi:CTP:phosphocholine cytidylyltransferase-like protein
VYIEKLALRDIYETENLGGYEKLYPPLDKDKKVD